MINQYFLKSILKKENYKSSFCYNKLSCLKWNSITSHNGRVRCSGTAQRVKYLTVAIPFKFVQCVDLNLKKATNNISMFGNTNT